MIIWASVVHFALLISASNSTAAAKSISVYFNAKPSAAQAANLIQDNFLGISHELSPFNTLWGNTASTLPHAMINYLSNIRARISHPLRIRIGGSGMDSSTYVPSQKEMIYLTDPDAYFNDIPCDFGPMLFEVMNAMADNSWRPRQDSISGIA